MADPTPTQQVFEMWRRGLEESAQAWARLLQPPAAPSNLTATAQAGPQVLLSWTDNATNESGFVIERAVNGGAFTTLVTVGPRNNTGGVTYTDVSVAAGSTYAYRVAAANAAGLSAWSNTANVTIPAPPAAPS